MTGLFYIIRGAYLIFWSIIKIVLAEEKQKTDFWYFQNESRSERAHCRFDVEQVYNLGNSPSGVYIVLILCYTVSTKGGVAMSSTITVRVEDKLKKQAGDVFREVGMDMSTAITVYLKQVVRTNGIPFPVSAEVPNALTLKAIQEAEKGEMATFSSIDALMEDLND